MSQTRGGTSADQVTDIVGIAGAAVEVRGTPTPDGQLLAQLVTTEYGIVPPYQTPTAFDGDDVWLRARTSEATDWGPFVRVPGDRVGAGGVGGGVTDYNDLDNKPALAPVATAGTFASLTDRPATYPPSAHQHVVDEVNGLVATINNAAAAGDSITLAQAQAYADAINLDLSALVTMAEESADIATLAAAVQALSATPGQVTQSQLDAEASARSAGDVNTLASAQSYADSVRVTSYNDLENKPFLVLNAGDPVPPGTPPTVLLRRS